MIKQIFSKYIRQRAEDSKTSESGKFKVAVSFAMCDVTELYSQIFGISYDEAANKLHEEINDQKEASI